MSAVLRWEEPPPNGRTRRRKADEDDHVGIAAALRGRPGEWAVISVSGALTGVTSHIRNGRIAAYRPAGSFDAARRMVDGEVVVYARYLGEESP